MKLDLILARLVAIMLFAAVAGGLWDSWWHSAIGRESFWIPPHLLIYASTVLAVLFGLYGWFKTKAKVWHRLMIALVFVIAAGPFDEFWHRIFSIESIASPLIVWSPPHLMIIGALLCSLLFVLPILSKDSDLRTSFLFSSLALGAVLMLGEFLVMPLHPFAPYHLINFWGAFFDALILVLVLLASRRYLSTPGTASLVVVFYLILILIGTLGESKMLNPNIPLHPHAPPWLNVFSILIAAITIDFLFTRIPVVILGGLAALLSASIAYGFSHFFFEPQFQYSLEQGVTAIVSGMIGGIVGGMISGIKRSSSA